MDINAARPQLLRLKPLLWSSAAFIAAHYLGALIEFPAGFAPPILQVFFLLLFLANFFLPRLFRARVPIKQIALLRVLLISTASFLFGVAQIASALSPPSQGQLSYYADINERVEIIGRVNSPPTHSNGLIRLEVSAEQIKLRSSDDWIQIDGKFQIDVVTQEHILVYGDRILLEGFLEVPEGDLFSSYAAYLASRGIDAQMVNPAYRYLDREGVNLFLAAIYDFREAGLNLISDMYPQPSAALLSGILFGDESGISPALKEDFNRTGTRHVIAISGFNIAIIAALFISIFRRWLGPRHGSWLALLGIAAYTLMVGADAAVMRAAVMAVLALFARQAGRRQSGITLLLFAAALMTLFNPFIVWDIAFQLSFSATLGIVLFADRFTNWTRERLGRIVNEGTIDRILPWITDTVLLTLAAQITTLPILLYHFHRFSLSSFPANFLILPAQPAIMLLGGASVLLAFVLFPLGQLLAWATWPFLAFTIRLVELVAQQNWASNIVSDISLTFVIAYFLLVIWLARRQNSISDPPFLRSSAFAIFSISMLIIAMWLFALSRPDGRTRITLLGDREGTILLLQSAQGRNLVLDLGSDPTLAPDRFNREVPVFNRSLDWLLISSESELPRYSLALEALSPSSIAILPSGFSPFALARLEELSGSNELPLATFAERDSLSFGQEARLQLIASNRSGDAFMLTVENFSLLITNESEPSLLREIDRILKFSNIDLLLVNNSPMNLEDILEAISQASPPIVLTNSPTIGLEDSAFSAIQVISLLESNWLRIFTSGTDLSFEAK